MSWIRERDALIAQTLAFVQSVTGKKDDVLQDGGPSASPAATVEIVAVEALEVEPPQPPPQPQPVQLTRASGDFRSEMQSRIANFRRHQERFEREREEYCAATLSKLRAAIRDGSPRPPAKK